MNEQIVSTFRPIPHNQRANVEKQINTSRAVLIAAGLLFLKQADIWIRISLNFITEPNIFCKRFPIYYIKFRSQEIFTNFNALNCYKNAHLYKNFLKQQIWQISHAELFARTSHFSTKFQADALISATRRIITTNNVQVDRRTDKHTYSMQAIFSMALGEEFKIGKFNLAIATAFILKKE